MKIFYIAVHEMNRNWGAEWFVNKGFVANGHQTYCLDYRRYRADIHNRFNSVPADYDVLFLQRGDGFPTDLLESTDKPKVFWASELVSRRRDQDRLFAWGKWDHVFVHSPSCLETVVQRGWIPREKLSVLLNGFDSDTHRKVGASGIDPHAIKAKDIDVLFVGSMTPRRQQILGSLNRHVNITVQRAFGPMMADLFRRAKIVLNIHAEEQLDVETRVFEALGCGSFVLSEKLDTFSPFVSGQHFVEVAGEDEMLAQIRHYLTNEREREKIAAQGHHEAVTRHSYYARSQDLVKVFERCATARG